jgi:transposase
VKIEIDQIFHQLPRAYGIERTRWRLQDLVRVLDWLNDTSVPGVSRLLKRLDFSCKQALAFIHSPDPAYASKVAAIAAARVEAQQHPSQVLVLYLDELTYYRRPTKSPTYARCGKEQPRALEAPRSNTQTRIVAVLNALSGQVTYLQRSKVGKAALVAFYAQVRAAYPQAEKLYVVQDNWPNHKLPEVMDAMLQQGITPLFLPTYASWLNPIEKLWRWLKQTIIHLHPFANDLEQLRLQVRAFLDQFLSGSQELLHYVGLLSG